MNNWPSWNHIELTFFFFFFPGTYSPSWKESLKFFS